MLLRYSVQTQSSYYYVFDVYNNNSDKDLIVSFSNNKLNIVLDVVNIISFALGMYDWSCTYNMFCRKCNSF